MHDSTKMQLNLARSFNEGASRLQLACGMRSVDQPSGLELLRDSFEGAECLFVRAGSTGVSVVLDGQYKVEVIPGGGWLVVPAMDSQPTYWLPRLPIRRNLDADGHILVEKPAAIEGIEAAPSMMALRIGAGEGVLDFVVWRLDDPLLVEELGTLTPLEQQAWYMWGSHTVYARPADVYQHLIYGHVYENRTQWPFYWKICSENDAHALYVTLTGLFRATGKRIYDLLCCQLALSVIDRLGEDGAFRHGEWSKGMESHYRLHASGMHLMMDHLAERDDPAVAATLARAASFLASRPDRTELGAWFLHDDLEQSPESMKQSPFTWKPSRVLGKSPSNMLVLNTHLDTLIGLDRFSQQSGQSEYAGLVDSAVGAVNKVLALRPAEVLYRMVSSILYLTFLPAAKAASLPMHQRVIKRIGWKWLAPRLHLLKTAHPRLVMPGGYIDRAVSLKGVSDAYQSINLMDLLRFARRFPATSVDDVLHEALAFTHKSGLLDRWAEIPQKAYALGFWAEALWHACMLYPNIEYRIWLAEAMLRLEAKNMGLPPSLLGANAEAIPLLLQRPCPIPADSQLRVANLCQGDKQEFLIINPTNTEIELNWITQLDGGVRWTDPDGRRVEAGFKLPVQGWLHGRNG
jgi:hypothetical protein